MAGFDTPTTNSNGYVNVQGATSYALNGQPINGASTNSTPPQRQFLTAGSDVKSKILQTLSTLRSLLGSQSKDYPLPQIVVCGSQSSGKSSVLEALTGIPFPRQHGLCTRYVTQVTVQLSHEFILLVEIFPDPERTIAEQKELAKWKKKYVGHDLIEKLPPFMEEATAQIFSGSRAKHRFAQDVLAITVSGPDKQPLQLMDVPGITYARDHNPQNPEIVKQITRDLIKQKHSLILAVLPAKNDKDGYEIIDMCDEVDPGFTRVLRVVTKPDEAGGDAEDYIRDVTNQEEGQWHVLRNRSRDELRQGITAEQRDAKEREFFSLSPWNVIPKERCGIENLRTRLDDRLFQTSFRQLPLLQQKLTAQLEEYRTQLSEYEEFQPDKTRKIIRVVTNKLREMAMGHAESTYKYNTHKFPPESPIFLRSRVRAENELFHDWTNEYGQAWKSHILPEPLNRDEDAGSIHRTTERPKIDPKILMTFPNLDKELEYVSKEISHLRGCEQPYMTNSRVVVDRLFWRMSSPWIPIAEQYVDRVFQHIRNYFECAAFLAFARSPNLLSDDEVDGFSPERADRVARRFIDEQVIPRMEKQRKAAREELQKLDRDREQTPQIYNRKFNADYRHWQQKKYQDQCIAIMQQKPNEASYRNPAINAVGTGLDTQEGYTRKHAAEFLCSTWSLFLVSGTF